MQSDLENKTASFDCDKSTRLITNQVESKFNAFLNGNNKLFKNLLGFTMLDLDKNSNCSNNCSGHGECGYNGICFCEVDFFFLELIR